MNSYCKLPSFFQLVLLLSLACRVSLAEDSEALPIVTRIASDGVVVASLGGRIAELKKGEALGRWTLMAVARCEDGKRVALFEDFSQLTGRLVSIDERGVRAELGKSLEPTWGDPSTLYRGHTLQEVFDSPRDLLAEELLAGGREPEFSEV